MKRNVLTPGVDPRRSERGGRRRRRRSLLVGFALAALLSATVAFGAPTSASAYSAEFTCGVINPGTWCEYTVAHHYSGLDAEYRGVGNVAVCAKLIYTNGAEYVKACAVNAVGFSDNPSNWFFALVYNGGPNPHTIWGVGFF
jgi:hypothetical protein